MTTVNIIGFRGQTAKLSDGTRAVVNTHQTAARPLATKYLDKPPVVTYVANFSARTARNQYRKYDGAQNVPSGLTLLYDFDAKHASGHHIYEVIKGILLQDPELATAPRSQLVLEVVYQLSTPAERVFIKKNMGMLVSIFSKLPLSGILSKISILLKHDGDIEAALDDVWWNRQNMEAPIDTKRDEDAAREYFYRRQIRSSEMRAIAAADAVADDNQRLKHKVEEISVNFRGKKKIFLRGDAPQV